MPGVIQLREVNRRKFSVPEVPCWVTVPFTDRGNEGLRLGTTEKSCVGFETRF